MKNLLRLLIVIEITFIGCASGLNLNQDSEIFISTAKDPVAHRIELFPDQTFTYSIKGGIYETFTEGIWRRVENQIHFNSALKYKSGYVTIKSSIGSSSPDRFTLKIVDEKGAPLLGAFIQYGTDSMIVNYKNVATFKKTQDTLIKINFLATNYNLSLGEVLSDTTTLEIVPLDLTKLYLIDDVWKIRSTSIISSSGKKLYKQ